MINRKRPSLDYKCQKAIGKLKDGTTFTVWYTTDLVPENKDFQYANTKPAGSGNGI